MSVLVFGHEGDDIVPLYIPKDRREKTVRLFFQKTKTNSHYCVIKSMLRLIANQVSSKNKKSTFVTTASMLLEPRISLPITKTTAQNMTAFTLLFQNQERIFSSSKIIKTESSVRLKFLLTLKVFSNRLRKRMARQNFINNMFHQRFVCMLFHEFQDLKWNR